MHKEESSKSTAKRWNPLLSPLGDWQLVDIPTSKSCYVYIRVYIRRNEKYDKEKKKGKSKKRLLILSLPLCVWTLGSYTANFHEAA